MQSLNIPRELNKSIKLQLQDIERIVELHKQGYSQRQIAKIFGVSKFAISYWLLTPEKREEMIKRRKKVPKKPDNKEVTLAREKLRRKLYGTKRVLSKMAFKKLKSLDSKSLQKSYFWHKQKVEDMLKIEPLLILLK